MNTITRYGRPLLYAQPLKISRVSDPAPQDAWRRETWVEDPLGRWFYASIKHGSILRAGYCATCEGHDTPLEALDHQREYDLTQIVQSTTKAAKFLRYLCDICQAPTVNIIRVGHGDGIFFLCDTHNTYDTIAQLYDHIGAGLDDGRIYAS